VTAAKIFTHTFENGLVLLAEPMEWLESAALALLVPAGCQRDPLDRLGLANFTSEMMQRGCGARSSRQFVEDLDNLGVSRSSSVSNSHISFGGAMPAETLDETLAIHADLVRHPHLPADQVEDARMVCVQELRGLEDDLAQQALAELRRRRYPEPYGRLSYGTLAGVDQISLDDVRGHFESYFQPRGCILAVAGRIEWERLRDHVGQLFDDWRPRELPPIEEVPAAGGFAQIEHDSHQTHIGVAFPAVPYGHPDYYQARGAVGVLSDGMSSRLFTEIRENRGLCYTVYATCHSLKDRGSVFSYAGTTTERAQETLDVLLHELTRLRDGIGQDELDRLKSKIKAALIMQQESSPSRSGSIAGDWYYLGRVQTLEEISRIIDGLTPASINAYLEANPPQDFTIVTVGKKKLELPVGIS
jgi:predicted Zn-dependent peptidase